ncbi:RNA polymerase sigma factor [Ferruginibacter albus]|uniref:RNA polymerase sigma factor n=1 Tax=Ferruginibacter albus TaxID=2875540 RepID=UPI001CC4FDDC|nr:RNA polymerase sigma factor [Ferruginibacter albus]UAY53095.1 RNA polymerase sigma factor [Ferruginibacter albus]
MNSIVKYKEEELLVLLKSKDRLSFEYLYDNYCGSLYGIIMKIIGDKEIADEVLQDVFLNVWKRIESYDPLKGTLFTWMLSISRNLAIDYMRSKAHKKHQRNCLLSEEIFFCSNVFSVNINIDTIGIKKAIGKLSPEYENLIDMVYFKGFTQREIAEILEIPLGTVKTKLKRSLIQLRVCLFKYDFVQKIDMEFSNQMTA